MSIPLALSLALIGTPGSAAPKVRNSDAETIEVALLQFFTPELESWQETGWRKGTTVLLWGQLNSKQRRLAGEILQEWIDPAARYESDPKHGAAVREMLAPVRALSGEVSGVAGSFRPPAIVPLASLAFDPRIAVGEPKPTGPSWRIWWQTPLPNGRQGQPRVIAHVDPPAYSGDGRIAVVKMNVPWSVHSADLLFGLRWDGDRWTHVFVRTMVHLE